MSLKRRIARVSEHLEAMEGRTADQAAAPALPEEMDYPALRIAEDVYFATLDEGHERPDALAMAEEAYGAALRGEAVSQAGYIDALVERNAGRPVWVIESESVGTAW